MTHRTLTPANRNQYRFDDWVEYLQNCKGIPELKALNNDHLKYIESVVKIRDLTDSEDAFLMACRQAGP